MKFDSVITFLINALIWSMTIYSGVDAQAAAWPATSYSPFFQNLFAQASAPVAALPSGPGAQAPAIPMPAAPFGPPGK